MYLSKCISIERFRNMDMCISFINDTHTPVSKLFATHLQTLIITLLQIFCITKTFVEKSLLTLHNNQGNHKLSKLLVTSYNLFLYSSTVS